MLRLVRSTTVRIDYLLNLDMEVDKSTLDAELLENFIADHEEDFTSAADINRCVLIYHRGVGVDTKESFFLMEKVSQRELYSLWCPARYIIMLLGITRLNKPASCIYW